MYDYQFNLNNLTVSEFQIAGHHHAGTWQLRFIGLAYFYKFHNSTVSVFAVFFLPEVFFNNTIGVMAGLELYRILLGFAVISGHVWNVFLSLKGGKGVATTAGVLLILAPNVLIASVLVWIFVFFLFRIVSVASIVSGIFLPVFALVFNHSICLVLFCVFLCIMGTYKHKANIRRLTRGEEKKLF